MRPKWPRYLVRFSRAAALNTTVFEVVSEAKMVIKLTLRPNNSTNTHYRAIIF